MDYVVALGEALQAAGPDEKVRVAEALRALEDSRAEPYLLRALDEPDREARIAVAYALSFTATTRSEATLIQLLGDPDFPVRVWAAYGLAHVGSREAVPRLIEALRDEEECVVAAAISALGEIGDAEAVGPLAGLLRGREHVHLVLQSLGTIGCRDAADAVAAYLDDVDPNVRYWALRAFRCFPESAPVDRLEKLIREEKSGIDRSMAEDLLRRRGLKAHVMELHE
jgi:HEAT repeat protein